MKLNIARQAADMIYHEPQGGMMKTDVTGIILAGGENRRMNFRLKALMEIGGRPIVQHIYSAISPIFSRIIIVTNSPLDFIAWDAVVTTDIFSHRSSLTGIHAGLFYMETPYAFVCACDTPFLKESLVRTVVSGIEKGVDAVVPDTDQGWEPLCAVYAGSCVNIIADQLTRKLFSIRRTFERLRVKHIGEDDLRRSDPDLESFINVNTPEDLERVRRLVDDREKAEQ